MTGKKKKERESNDPSLYPYSESNATARLILHQLQFLENVVNPGGLAKSLLEVIESVQRTAQAELITSIPYILSHSDFNVKKAMKYAVIQTI
jgi:hypothetical protein